MIKRPSYLSHLIQYKDNDLIKVITGIRRCGKSYLLFNIFYNYLLDSGVDESHIIRVNLEDLENKYLRDELELYDYILLRKQDNNKYYVMIVEIQYINKFEDLLNSLKNKGFDVYVTGSNSHLLSKDISTALRGRSIEIRVYPLSFKEFYEYKQGDILERYNEYITYGGLPYVCIQEDIKLKIEYLKMLEETRVIKDIEERYKARNLNYLRAVYDNLCSSIGSIVSAKKITDTLKSNGYSIITADSVINYLLWFNESFLFSKVYRYDIRGKEYLKTLNKYYAMDIGLRNAHINFRQVEPTHILENVVYLELLRRGYLVDIGKNNNKEIDFVAKNNDELLYIQVAYSIMDEDKCKTELESFKGLDDGYRKIVITLDNDPFTKLENGYTKLNLFDFLLNKGNVIV